MRSQATKTQPKKGALVKPTFKQNAVKKKQIASSKNVKHLLKKATIKTVKKKKVTKPENKNEEPADGDPSKPKPDTSKAETSKSPVSTRSNSPAKKNKNENKQKKVSTKKPTGLLSKKKNIKQSVKLVKKIPVSEDKQNDSGDEIKYKINSEHVKVKKTKCTKTKVFSKTTPSATNPKKPSPAPKIEEAEPYSNNKEKDNTVEQKSELEMEKSTKPDNPSPTPVVVEDKTAIEPKTPDKVSPTSSVISSTSASPKDLPPSTPQKPKTENERPPKFFTSSRSPRVVDIDLKSCKTTKTNISLTDKFLSMKLPDNKSDGAVENKAGEHSGTVSKEPEIDVYTFTDYKVDSPKSILPDFRSPIGKNIGRVRPIARVKGTIIDKNNKADPERKKYSPHRPIEEVVKQLKAGKRAEEARLLALSDNKLDSNKSSEASTSTSGESTGESNESPEPTLNEKPRNVVSKSYKMVARKSNIPGTTSVGCVIPSSTEVGSTPKDRLNKIVVKKSKPVQSKKTSNVKKMKQKIKKSLPKSKISDEDIDHSTFSLNTSSTSHAYSSSDESVSESNYDTKESSESEDSLNKKLKINRKKGKRICDSERKSTSKDLEALSPDSLIDLKESSSLIGEEKPSKRRLKLLSMWTGPKKHRMASLNALAKVHCLYENESRTHSELGLMKTVERNIPISVKPAVAKKKPPKPEKHESTSESEYEKKVKLVLESSEEDTPPPSTRNLRVVPGSRGSGKYWDHKSSTSSSEDSEADYMRQIQASEKRKPPSKPATPTKSDTEKPPAKMKKTAGVPIKKKRNRNEVVMDLKDMVVQKRMASLNATAILAASYEKRSPKSSKDETTTSDSCSDKDETYAKKSKNGVASGVKSEAGIKIDECKKEGDCSTPKQKVEVIVNQDTDVTITGVYSTHHEGFCTVSGLKYRISSTSHTQTTATASSEKEVCSHEDGARYTPLSALSSMQPPPADAEDPAAPALHPHAHPAHEHRGLGLGRRPGCSSAFSAPPPTHQHHEPGKLPGAGLPYDMAPPLSPIGYYQPAGPLIKESGGGAEAEGRALARYHPHAAPPHYHHPAHAHPHPPVLQHYGAPYYPAELCYGRYYPRPPGYMPPPQSQPDAQMVGVPGEPYPPPPPQYYSGGPCYHNSHQRVPYLEYRGCPCPMNSCPKNVLIGPATGKPPNSGGPADAPTSAAAPPGGAFRSKARAARGPEPETNITNGKDPPPAPEPPAAADAPHARYHLPHPPHVPPAFSGVSPKRELYPDSCEEFRVATDGLAAEALGPPSPARGSAGACVPQPPPAPAPQPLRRARLGKAMVRKTLVGEETAALLMSPLPASAPAIPRSAPVAPAPPAASPPDADDDVLVLSSPDAECAPIDLSSSDETEKREPRDRLLADEDVKKENEGPEGGAVARKPPAPAAEAQALREHNSPCAPPLEPAKPPEQPKPQPAKRRYSRPKLEIEPSLEIVDGRPTNGIGEHVKLQKRRKLVPEADAALAAAMRDTIDRSADTIDAKKKPPTPKAKRAQKIEPEVKRCNKRKSSSGTDAPSMKRPELEPTNVAPSVDARLQNPAAVCSKPKIRSALLLDKLIRKNSVDRLDPIGCDYEPDPAELFLPTPPSMLSSRNGVKKVININNNIVGETMSINGIQSTEPVPTRLIADRLLAKFAAGKLAEKKLTSKPSGKATVDKPVNKSSSDKISLKTQLLEKVKHKLTSGKLSKICPSEKKTNSRKLSKMYTATFNLNTCTNEAISDNEGEKVGFELDADQTEVTGPNVDAVESNENKTKVPCAKTDILKPMEKISKVLAPTSDDVKSTDKTSKLLCPKNAIKHAEKTSKFLCSKNDVSKPSCSKLLCSKSDITKPAEKTSKLLCSKNDINKPADKTSKLLCSKSDVAKPAEKTSKLLCSKADTKHTDKSVKLLAPKRAVESEDPDAGAEMMEAVEEVCTAGAAAARRAARRRRSGGRRRARLSLGTTCGASAEDLLVPRSQPRWSNGWLWEGEPYISKVYLNNDMRQDGLRRCYGGMVHAGGDRVRRGDCVLLRAAARRGPEQPYVARVAHLWENPDDGEMMVSLVWYYRPEHTELARQPGDAPDEVFASRHRDANSVACIEDKCYVLTFNEYCRYRKRLRAAEEGVRMGPSIVPPLPASEVSPGMAPNDSRLPPNVSPELVLFCRKIYDFRSKKIQVPNK